MCVIVRSVARPRRGSLWGRPSMVILSVDMVVWWRLRGCWVIYLRGGRRGGPRTIAADTISNARLPVIHQRANGSWDGSNRSRREMGSIQSARWIEFAEWGSLLGSRESRGRDRQGTRTWRNDE